MVYGAIDLHMQQSQIRIIDADGVVLRDKRVRTSRERLVQAFAEVGAIRIVLETGTESEWVAQALEAVGYEVVVVDPNYAPMYAEVHRRVKTDRRDAAALAEANRRGWYRPAHRRSTAQRRTQQLLRARRQIVHMRSGSVTLIRSLLKQEGYRLPSCGAARVPARLAAFDVPTGPLIVWTLVVIGIAHFALLTRNTPGTDIDAEAANAGSVARAIPNRARDEQSMSR